MTELPPFPGIRPKGLRFLADLKENNDRAWFLPRKSTLEDELIWPLKCLISELNARCMEERLPLAGSPQRSLFRIYRDIRFSSDKTPYKTHVSAVMTRSGEKNDPGTLYIHIEPGRTLLGGGFWHLEKQRLNRWREAMLHDPERFRVVLAALEARDLPLETDESLKRMPRGFEEMADSPLGPYFRWKSFVTFRKIDDVRLEDRAFVDDVVQMIRDALPLLEFGWQLEGGRK